MSCLKSRQKWHYCTCTSLEHTCITCSGCAGLRVKQAGNCSWGLGFGSEICAAPSLKQTEEGRGAEGWAEPGEGERLRRAQRGLRNSFPSPDHTQAGHWYLTFQIPIIGSAASPKRRNGFLCSTNKARSLGKKEIKCFCLSKIWAVKTNSWNAIQTKPCTSLWVGYWRLPWDPCPAPTTPQMHLLH